jgi:hypothetical protein
VRRIILEVTFVLGALGYLDLQVYGQPQNQPRPPGFQHKCISDGVLCEFPRENHPGMLIPDSGCNDGAELRERKFVCVSEPKKGQGFDVWCRVGGRAGTVHDNKCNLSARDACPYSRGLTQWTAEDHCTHAKPGDATGNWTPPPGWVVPPLQTP